LWHRCSYLGFEFATKQHTSCRAAPSNRSIPLLDYFEGTRETGDAAIGAQHPLVANRTYSTDFFEQKAQAIIAAHDATAPLFLFLSLSAVHKPYLARPGHVQRAALAHPGSYFRECPWTRGTPVKCRAHHRRGYEAMAVAVDDLVGAMVGALQSRSMWEHSLLIFASDK
jgi:hypothetical protein